MSNGLLGISFSIHAVVEDDQIVHSPYYPSTINLQKYYQDRYHVPVKIGNEANLAAIRTGLRKQNSADNYLVTSIHRDQESASLPTVNSSLATGAWWESSALRFQAADQTGQQVTELGDVFSSDHFLARLTSY